MHDDRLALGAELRKVAAFLRRDFLIAWSYRTSFFSDWVNMLGQVVVFYIVGRLVDPATLPSYDGRHVRYLEFAVVGISLTAFATLGLYRIANAMRGEQLMGTLESLLMTPTLPTTIQLGAVVYDLIYVPLRTALFLLLVAVSFGLHFHASGIAPALLVLLAFIPFVWGLGVAAAAATITYRRGISLFTFGLSFLAVGSTSYFPLTALPSWLRAAAERNPMTLAADGIRGALLGGAHWAGTARTLAELVPLGLVVLAIGALCFRLALSRERRRGTLALY
jgi:ABC-type polysaccharide/polyol phosphate export permease